MIDTILCRGPFCRIKGKHGNQPGGELLRHLRIPLVLGGQHIKQWPGAKLGDVSKFAVLLEKLLAVLSGGGDVPWDLTE